MLIYNRQNRSFEALDFREAAPGRIKSNAYDKDYNASRYGIDDNANKCYF